MSSRARIIAFGSCGVLVLAGALCAILIGGLIGQLLTFVLIAFGLGGAVLLVFLEVGLSEDRERAREEERRREQSRRERSRPVGARPGPRRKPRLQSPRWPRRPG
jgi:hypothetical protein